MSPKVKGTCLMTLLMVLPEGLFSRQATESNAQIEVYFTPFSHLDLFWGGTREESLARGNGIIA